MIIESLLWYAAFGGGAAWLAKKFSKGISKSAEEIRAVDPNAEPPNPGPFDPKRYRTEQQKNEWIKLWSAHVEWTRKQPRKPTPPPKAGNIVRLREM